MSDVLKSIQRVVQAIGVYIAAALFFPQTALLLAAGLLVGNLLKQKLDGGLSGAQKQSLTGAVVPARWVVGRARTAGVLARYAEDDRNAEAFLVVSEGAIDAIERVWINSEEATFTPSGGDLTDNLGSGPHEDRFRFQTALRADGTQTVAASIPGDYDPAVHRFRGMSWVFCHYNQPEYGNDLDQRFWTSRNPATATEFLIRGIKITWPGQDTPVWTENAAAIRYWYMRERLGIPAEAFDEPSVRAAVALCGETVTVSLPDGYGEYPTSAIRYSINGVVTATDRPAATLREFDFAWQGSAVEVNGVWHFRPGTDRPALRHLTPEAMLAVGAVQPQPPVQERTNTLTFSLAQSLAHDWLEYEGPATADDPTVLRDGETITGDLGALPYTQDPITAGRLVATILRRDRANAVYTYRVRPTENLEWMSAIPGDRILVTDPERGLDATPLRILAHTLHPDWSVEMTLQEAPDGLYLDDFTLPPLKPRPSAIFSPRRPPPIPTGLIVRERSEIQPDGTDAVSLSVDWTPVAVARTDVRWRRVLDGRYRLEWGGGATLEWGGDTELEWHNVEAVDDHSGQPAVLTSARIDGVIGGDIYAVQVRHVGVNGVASSWSLPVQQVVSGDQTAPAPPTGGLLRDFDGGSHPSGATRTNGVIASWTSPPDLDLDFVEVWRATSETPLALPSLAGAERVASSRSEEATLLLPLDDRRLDYALRSVDRSGNISAPVPIGAASVPIADVSTVWTGDRDLYNPAAGVTGFVELDFGLTPIQMRNAAQYSSSSSAFYQADSGVTYLTSCVMQLAAVPQHPPLSFYPALTQTPPAFRTSSSNAVNSGGVSIASFRRDWYVIGTPAEPRAFGYRIRDTTNQITGSGRIRITLFAGANINFEWDG